MSRRGDHAASPPTTATDLPLLRILRRIEAVPSANLALVGVASVLVIGTLDWLSGASVTLRVLYLIPIFVLTWAGGLVAGLVVAIGAVLVNLASVRAHDGALPSTELLNIGVRFAVYVLAAFFVRELHRLVDAETERSRRDPLTGALARWAFVDVLEHERQRAVEERRTLAVMHLDLNRFRVLAGAETTAEADELLQRVVAAAQDLAGDPDRVGRLGGDEFGLVLPDCDTERAHAVAAELRRATMARAAVDVPFGPGIGVALFERVPPDAEDLLAAADQLAFQAWSSEEGPVVARVDDGA